MPLKLHIYKVFALWRLLSLYNLFYFQIIWNHCQQEFCPVKSTWQELVIVDVLEYINIWLSSSLNMVDSVDRTSSRPIFTPNLFRTKINVRIVTLMKFINTINRIIFSAGSVGPFTSCQCLMVECLKGF